MSTVNIHLKARYFSDLEFGTLGGALREAAATTSPASAIATASTSGGKAPKATAAPAKAGKPASAAPAKPTATAVAAAEEEDKLVLPGAEHGSVVTRFPPEASGFIHIGHAKAALVNNMLAAKYGGKMLFRFDDTNPAKEKHDFEMAIVEDLGRLGVAWDIGPTYSSDYFDLMLEKAEYLIKEGLAYCDTTPRDEMQKCRYDGVPTKCRSNSVEENMRLWDEMKRGTDLGQTACLRAKMSIDDVNKALRDPVMYRVNVEVPHTRTGTRYKVYPTYDFCCPIVDSVEGVTHALRTNEYHDRNAQYDWFCNALKLRKPQVEDFSRLNMEYSVMSKRKLTQLVDDKVVDGWDDPRFPTVRALLRRGLKVEALREFVKVQGMSKAVNFMEWSKLWNFNTQILDPSVPRYVAVADDLKVTCTVIGGPAGLEECTKARHKKNAALGERPYYKSNRILLDAEDVALCADGEEVTLMDWGNAFVSEVKKSDEGVPRTATLTLNLQGDVKKTSKKLTWVADNDKNVRLVINEYDHLLTQKKPDPEGTLDGILASVTKFTQHALAEPALAEVQRGESFQLERRGYYIVDKIEGGVYTLIHIPDGKEKLNHLSAKAQHLKAIGASPTDADAKGVAKAKGGKTDDMSLEEKRAAKAAKKAASGKK